MSNTELFNVLLLFMIVICMVLMVLYIRERGKNKKK